jgi:hypothetical protein
MIEFSSSKVRGACGQTICAFATGNWGCKRVIDAANLVVWTNVVVQQAVSEGCVLAQHC